MVQRALCPTLIGRDDELSSLEDALLEAGVGDGRVAVIAGEAGMGKTRLASELRGRAARIGCTTLWGGCSEARLDVPYLPFLEAVGNHLVHADLTALRTRLGVCIGDLARLFPQFGVEPTVHPGDEPAQARLRLFEAIVTMLGAIAEERPLLLVVEDVHWADPSTLELLEYVGRRVVAYPLLLVVTYRVEDVHRQHPFHPILQGWHRDRLADHVELTALEPGDVAQIVGAIFEATEVSAELRDYLHARCEGNPFVLEEMLKEALDSGAIHRSATGWDRMAIEELHVPATVRDTILARVERLAPANRELLRRGAVIGSWFDADILVELSGLDETAVAAGLRTCTAQQLLAEADGRRGGYRFRHSLTWEVVHGDVGAPERARLHGCAAAVLERRGARPAERARHLAGAGRVEEAVPLWIAAAQEATRHHAYADAAALYELALPHIDDPSARALTESALGEAQLCASYANAPGATRHLESALAVLEAGGDERDAAHLRLVLGRCYWDARDYRSAREVYEAACRTLERFGPSDDLAMAYVRLANMEDVEGHWGSEARLARLAIETAAAAHSDSARLWGSVYLGCALCELGEHERGLSLLDRAHSEAMELDLDIAAAAALYNGVVMRWECGRAAECPPLIERLRAIPGQWSCSARFCDGLVAASLGDLDAARAAFLDVIRDTPPMSVVHHWARVCLCPVLSELGDAEQARAWLERPDVAAVNQDAVFDTVQWARTHIALGTPGTAVPEVERLLARFGGLPSGHAHGPPQTADVATAVFVATGQVERAARVAAEVEARGLWWSPLGRRATGRVLLAQGRPDTARAHLRRAATEFARAGYRVEEVETRLQLADALVALGDDARAAREARRALAGARTCRATPLAAAAEATLRRLGRDLPPAPAPPPALRVRSATQAVEVPREPRAVQPVTVLVARLRHASASGGAGTAERMTRLAEWARREVERRLGVVDDEADGLVATFGDGEATADHCRRAVGAALALVGKAAMLDLQYGVGVAAAKAVSGGGHDGENARFTASRLQASAGAGVVVLGDDVYTSVETWVREHRLSATPVRVDGDRTRPPSTGHALRRERTAAPPPAAPPTPGPLAGGNLFRRDGEYWTVEYGGRVVRVRDSRGCRDMATLLARPGCEVAAVALVAATADAAPRAGGAVEPGMTLEGDAGPVLDIEAARQYRQRVADLDEEIGAAEVANDSERATRAREERELLLAELGAAVGLSGRRRRMLDPAERARKAVTWRLRDAISRIEAADPRIGAHLRRSVRTGAFCVYDPDEPTTWSV